MATLTIYGVTSHIPRNPYLNGRQVSNNKRQQLFTSGTGKSFDELLSPSWVTHYNRDYVGVAPLKCKTSDPPRISIDFHLQEVLFHYNLLSIIVFIYWGVEYNSYNTITRDMTKYTHSHSSAARSRESCV